MVRHRNKSPPHQAPLEPTPRGFRIPTERERRLSNLKVLCLGGGEASRDKELGKGEEQVKDNPLIKGDRKQPMLIRDLSEEGVNKADQEGEDQEGDYEEGEAYNINYDVTVMVFSCSMTF